MVRVPVSSYRAANLSCTLPQPNTNNGEKWKASEGKNKGRCTNKRGRGSVPSELHTLNEKKLYGGKIFAVISDYNIFQHDHKCVYDKITQKMCELLDTGIEFTYCTCL